MSTATAQRNSTAQHPTSARAARGITIAAATAAAVGVWVVAGPLAGIDLQVRAGTSHRTVGLVSVIATALIAGAIGAGVLALLERTGWARRIWFPLASTALIGSLAGPLGALTLSAGVALAAMHLVVGLILLVGLGRTTKNDHC